MQARTSLIRELEQSIRDGSHSQRVTTLRRVTDLFVETAQIYDAEQVMLFDDVIVRLAGEIEKTALAELSRRLAPIANAPEQTVRKLAFDESLEVAGPVLAQSPRLTDADLIEVARTQGQGHLLAISARETVGEAVTDVLVARGGPEVVRKVVANEGARFSEAGFTQLVERANGDDRLAAGVGKRIDIPPHLFRRLVIEATSRVQEKLLSAASPETKAAIEQLLSEIRTKVVANPELASRRYSAAGSFVRLLAESGRLGTRELVNFAKGGRFEETVTALAELSQVPVDIVDRVMHGDSIDPLLVLCRAKGYDWTTVRAVLLARRNCMPMSASALEQACQDYNMLSDTTAERVLRFWQVRQNGQ